MRIACLCEHPQHLPSLAQAHVQAFGALLPDWNVVQAQAELVTHGRDDAIPTTWIALDDDAGWQGSVSLLRNDHDDIRQYSPWLATLYVRPEARAAGVGAALVRHCVQAAARMGVPRLYLYCTDARVAYYARMGWQPHDRIVLGPLRVVVMAIDTGARVE